MMQRCSSVRMQTKCVRKKERLTAEGYHQLSTLTSVRSDLYTAPCAIVSAHVYCLYAHLEDLGFV